MNDYVELRKALNIVLRRWWLLILIPLIVAAMGNEVSQRQPSVYEATTTIMVGQFMQATELSRADLLTSEVLAQTYADMARRQPVLQGVVDVLGLSYSWRSLRRRIRVQLVEGTQLLEVKAEAGSTAQARAISDEVARQLILLSPTAMRNRERAESREFMSQRISNLQTRIEGAQARVDTLEEAIVQSGSAQQVVELQNAVNTLEGLIASWEANYTQMSIYMETENPSNSLTIIEPAQARPRPVRPRTHLNTVLAGAVGFVLALGLAVLLELWNHTLRSAVEVNTLLGTTVLGTISSIRGKRAQDKLLLYQEPAAPVAEAYRTIRSNIQFTTADQHVKSIVVTSPGPGEGKSITAANLGIIMAQAGLRTIVVDADLRQPAQHQLFQVANSRGLVEAIRSPELDLSSQVMDTRVPNLQVLTSGNMLSNPAELLGSQGMRQVLASLSSMADVVICDSPPALGLADARILANRADGVVLVIEAGQTHADDARQAVSILQQADASLLGVVLNRGNLEHLKYHAFGRRKTAYGGRTVHSRSSRLWQWRPF
jgi:succinoglycan biosynthesis transport protein ExoP